MKISRKSLVASIFVIGLAITGAAVKATAAPAPPGDDLLMTAGTHITFLDGTPEDPGVITVEKGTLEVQFYDGSWAFVGMGKYPVLQAFAVHDSEVTINRSMNLIDVTIGTCQSRSWTRPWKEWSRWVD